MKAGFIAFLWTMAAAGVALIVAVGAYTISNPSGHTGWEPFTALAAFVLLSVVGIAGIAINRWLPGIYKAGIYTLAVGVIGAGLILFLDGSNRLVQYDRWVERGMP